MTCKFGFRVVGGSSEEWVLELLVDGAQARCAVGRPRSTYLHFLGYHLTVEGKSVTSAEAFDNDGRGLLREEDFTVEGDTMRQVPGNDNTVNRIVMEVQ